MGRCAARCAVRVVWWRVLRAVRMVQCVARGARCALRGALHGARCALCATQRGEDWGGVRRALCSVWRALRGAHCVVRGTRCALRVGGSVRACRAACQSVSGKGHSVSGKPLYRIGEAVTAYRESRRGNGETGEGGLWQMAWSKRVWSESVWLTA